jgi:antitoxin (DNA-binding transcriptional repressor) of toxin-antitoxin stability system
MTKTMGIREVTRHTSKVIHEAAAGETVIITEHDQPIAMLVPLPRTGDPVVDQLIREGKLSPASNPGGLAALLAIRPVAAGDDSDTAEVVSDLRADRI